VFLGAYGTEAAAAAAVDLVAVKAFADRACLWPALAGMDAAGAAAALGRVPSLNLDPAAYVPCLPTLAAVPLEPLVEHLRSQSKASGRGGGRGGGGGGGGPSVGDVTWADMFAACGVGVGPDGVAVPVGGAGDGEGGVLVAPPPLPVPQPLPLPLPLPRHLAAAHSAPAVQGAAACHPAPKATKSSPL
jgi:hypothetical protein